MKYIYLILITLSSFFTNKSLQANQDAIQVAFFMPPNSMQQNIYVPTFSDNSTPKDIQPAKETPPASQTSSKTNNTTHTTIETKPTTKKTLPITRKKIPVVINETIKKQPQNKTQQPAIKQQPKPTPITPIEFSDIDFDNNINVNTEKNTTQDEDQTQDIKIVSTNEENSSLIKQLYQKDLKDLLYSVSYPDRKQPKYKQIYNTYLLDLRRLYRYKRLSENTELNLALKKANSMKKFEVK